MTHGREDRQRMKNCGENVELVVELPLIRKFVNGHFSRLSIFDSTRYLGFCKLSARLVPRVTH